MPSAPALLIQNGRALNLSAVMGKMRVRGETNAITLFQTAHFPGRNTALKRELKVISCRCRASREECAR